ncbi:MAG: FAD:protein FMN transferase [Akkermansiaceae bacterium]|jgi:thiamine biosynthesis lipoprotein
MTKPSVIKKSLHSLVVLVKSTAYWGVGLCFIFQSVTSLVAQHGEAVEPALDRQYFSQPHLGTIVQIAFYANDKERSQLLAGQCFERVETLNKTFSDYLPDSEVSQLCAKPAKVAYTVSDDLFCVMAQAQEISKATEGAFDITLGRATQKWRESARQNKLLPETGENQATFQDVILNPKKKTVLLRQPLKIDLGGIAKGYIADQLMVILKQAGIRQAAVIIGGEMVFTEAPPGKEGWRVGVERPSHETLGVLTLSNTALSTSGDSYQFFELDGVRHAHLIDPASGKAKSNRLNVTTLAPSAILADAWATALRVSTPENALKLASERKEIEAAYIPFGIPATFTAGFPKLQKPEQRPG